ncbi:hypothetical protein ACRAWD_04455 [Caulobacter segnis]
MDPRIRTVAYDPDQVVRLTGYFGIQTMLEFAGDERIENVSIGGDAMGLAGDAEQEGQSAVPQAPGSHGWPAPT